GVMIASIALVLGFRKSDTLASAYGIAVSGTMTVTSILFYVVARRRFGWSRRLAGALVALFLVVDLSFLLANADKIGSGGWFPIVVALAVFSGLTSWKGCPARLGHALVRPWP